MWIFSVDGTVSKIMQCYVIHISYYAGKAGYKHYKVVLPLNIIKASNNDVTKEYN